VILLENFDFPEGPLNDDWALFGSVKFYVSEFSSAQDYRIVSKEAAASTNQGRFHVNIPMITITI
jgi:hypothetical protein